MDFWKFFRRALPYSTVAVVIALGYSAWVLHSRASANRDIDRAAQQREADANRKIVQQYGDGQLKILMFYASPGAIARGGSTLLCYGVANAASVRIEPHIEDLGPSLSRCIEVKPRTTTSYKLTAQGKEGASATQSVNIEVR
jgi:hypothetical protein